MDPEINCLLEDVGLDDRYRDIFAGAGIDDITILMDMTKNDLLSLGIKVGHVNKIRNKAMLIVTSAQSVRQRRIVRWVQRIAPSPVDINQLNLTKIIENLILTRHGKLLSNVSIDIIRTLLRFDAKALTKIGWVFEISDAHKLINAVKLRKQRGIDINDKIYSVLESVECSEYYDLFKSKRITTCQELITMGKRGLIDLSEGEYEISPEDASNIVSVAIQIV